MFTLYWCHTFTINIVAAFRGMHVSPAKHSYAWLPRKCDYRTDTQTDRCRTKWSLCAAMHRRRHKKKILLCGLSKSTFRDHFHIICLSDLFSSGPTLLQVTLFYQSYYRQCIHVCSLEQSVFLVWVRKCWKFILLGCMAAKRDIIFQVN